MGPYATIAILLSIVWAQQALMPYAALGNASPFLPLVAVVCWGLLRGPDSGLAWALVVGLMLDQLSPSPVGMYTVPLVAAAGVLLIGRRLLMSQSVVVPAALVTVATLVYVTVQEGLIGAVGGHVPWAPETQVALIVPRIVLNLLWFPAVFFPLRALARRIGGPRLDLGWGG